MKHTRNGNRVTLEMTVGQWESLLMLTGMALGGIYDPADKEKFYGWLQFVNDLNTGNPNFTPYQIPEEFQRPV